MGFWVFLQEPPKPTFFWVTDEACKTWCQPNWILRELGSRVFGFGPAAGRISEMVWGLASGIFVCGPGTQQGFRVVGEGSASPKP